VNFATQKATLHYDPAAVTADKIIQEVQEIGYEVPAQRLTMPISGMHCASCAATIERAFHTVPGVIEAQVNFATARATVAYIPTLATAETLRQAVKNAGYQPLESQDTPSDLDRERQARAVEIRTLKRKFVVSLCLSVPIFLGSMGAMVSWVPAWLQHPYLLLVLATPIQFWVGWQFYEGLRCLALPRP
jgi:Cu+-exporting ATPase